MHSLPATPALTRGHKGIAAEAGAAMAWLGVQLHRLGAAWTARRRAARELEELFQRTDYELRDMGISRSDFPAIMQGTYRRD
jgi:uncharacterized protein YjiS (DUF1127 family)